MRLNSLLTLFTIALTLSGCGGGGGGSTATDPILPPTEIDVNVTITDDYQVESLGTANTINANVSVGNTAKDLYLVLSNSANVPGSTTITHNPKITAEAQAKIISPTVVTEKRRILHHPDYVQDFNSQIGTLFSKAESSQRQAKIITVTDKNQDIVGNQTFFCVNINQDNGVCSETTLATSKKVVSGIETAYGPKTLNIWVSNDSFSGPDCTKSKCITDTMVDELANTFLLDVDGLNNDIYDWVTNVYGEEWTNAAQIEYSNLIGENDEITILLTDINNDNSANGGVIGFFWSKDNFKTSSIPGSNERVMFYIDSVMFANEDGLSWEIDDYWPKETISTLAHEFQHMIHFYQKTVLLANDNTDTWINEMLSESTEDLIATKIRHIGPRGVDYLDGSAGDPDNTLGRYPLFNANNTLTLPASTGPLDQNGNPTFVLADYSKVNAFGAYLLRNYGGAKLLHDIMYNSYTDVRAVVSAVGSGKTFANLLSEWGVAVMLSDHINLSNTPFYNTGDFSYDDYNGITYELGSINFFNYILLDQFSNIIQDGPKIYTTSGTVQPQGNYYYKIGDNLTGDLNITLELNGQTEATLIAK
ncbi:hypothetical protein TSL6_04090 [Sulfurovum sp. TSL6]|uniref:M30 family zinc metallopeptidase n=1 Tax=Sulfurovum sp. TSL6 TaxID=2826995 RepID=UPI001CC77FAB|nr:hypothetical protein [Sulfurovum sp. TSL6]GIT99902.1 hypothetical protein TSL6_04090 [Sulfurovum sp. TSL6]